MISGKDNRRFETKQIHPRIDKELVQELKRESRQRKKPESVIVEAALKIFFSQTEHEAVIERRLNKLQIQSEKLLEEQQCLLETLATFVKVYLAHTPAIPDSHKAASEEGAVQRFERFVQLVSRALENKTLFKNAIEEQSSYDRESSNL